MKNLSKMAVIALLMSSDSGSLLDSGIMEVGAVSLTHHGHHHSHKKSLGHRNIDKYNQQLDVIRHILSQQQSLDRMQSFAQGQENESASESEDGSAEESSDGGDLHETGVITSSVRNLISSIEDDLKPLKSDDQVPIAYSVGLKKLLVSLGKLLPNIFHSVDSGYATDANMVSNLKSLMDKIKMFKLASAMDREDSKKEDLMRSAIMKLTHGLNGLLDSAENNSSKKKEIAEGSDSDAEVISSIFQKPKEENDDDKVHSLNNIIKKLKKVAVDSDDEDYPHPPPTLHPDPDMHPEMYPENPNTTKRRSREKKERLEKEEERAEKDKERRAARKVIEQERDDAIERAERGE